MENPRFRMAPDISDYKIPFAINEQALIDWLRALSMQQNYNSGKEVFCLLRAFTDIEIDPRQHLTYLQKIHTYLDDLVKQLERNYLDAGCPLNTEERMYVDIVTFAYAMLAENYSLSGRRLIEQPNAPDIKELAFYLAFQAAGKALLHMSQVYTRPYEGFWLFCYQIYSLAEKAGFLDMEIKDKDFKGKTVHAAFKHILMFELSDTYQFRPREMREIYGFLEDFSVQAAIMKKIAEQSASGLCAFNLEQDQEPGRLIPSQAVEDEANRYVSPVNVAKKIYRFLQQESTGQGALKSINQSLFMRVVKSLSLTQKRRYTRVAEQREGLGIIGFNNLISFSYKKDSNGKEDLIPTQKRDPRIAGKWDVPNLDLVPEGSEWMQQMESHYRHDENSSVNKILKLSREMSHDGRVWQSSAIEKRKLLEEVATGTFETLNSSAQGLYVLWQAVDLRARVGDIFALLSAENERVEIGLIRRVNLFADQCVGLGIEMIGFESEVVGLTRPGQKELTCWAIFLPGIKALKQQDSIVYNTSDFSVGEFVNMRHGKKNISCRLHKLINSTPAVSHVELFYTEDSV